MERRENDVIGVAVEFSSNTVQKITDGATKTTEESSLDGSSLSEDNVEERIPHHHLPLDKHLMSNFVAKEGTPAVTAAAQVLHINSRFSLETSHPASLTEVNPQTTDYGGHAVADYLGEETSTLDCYLSGHTEIDGTIQSGESVEQLVLQSLNDQTETEREDKYEETPAASDGKADSAMYHSVLRQLQQQQKHKRGRRFRKKTLMKMAKLFVLARGWDPERMGVKHSLSEHKQLEINYKEDTFTSLSSNMTQQENWANSPKDAMNDLDTETFPAMEIFPGQTEALGTLEKKSVTKNSKQHPSPHTFTECDDVMSKDISEAVVLKYGLGEPSVFKSESESYPSAVLTGKMIKKRQKKNKTELDDGKNDLDKETVLSTVSTDTFSRQTEVKKKRSYTCKKLATEESQLSGEPVTVEKTKRSYTGKKTVTKDVVVFHNESILDSSPSVQDRLFNGSDLNAAKQEHDKRDISKFPSEAASLFQDDISPDKSHPSAVPVGKTLRKRQEEAKKKSSYARKKTLTEKSMLSAEPVLLQKRKRSYTRKKTVTKDVVVFHNESILDSSPSVQHRLFNGSDLNAAKQEHDKKDKSKFPSMAASSLQDEISVVETDPFAVPAGKTIRKSPRKNKIILNNGKKEKYGKSELSEFKSDPESDPSAGNAGKIIKKRQRKNKTELDDGNNDLDQETVLSSVSIDTFSGQTEGKKKIFYSGKKTATEESQFYETAETLIRRKVGVKKNSKQNISLQTLKEYNGVMEQDDSGDVMVSHYEPLLDSGYKIPDILFNMMDLNTDESDKSEAPVILQKKKRSYTRKKPPAEETGALKRKKRSYSKKTGTDVMFSHYEPLLDSSFSIKDRIFNDVDVKASNHESGRSEPSELNSEAASSLQDEISLVEFVPSAVPAGKTLRKRQQKNTLDEGRKDMEKETVLSNVSTETFSGQTKAEKKRYYVRKKILTQDVMLFQGEHLLDSGSSVQDVIFNGIDFNTSKQEYDKRDISKFPSSLFQDEISPVKTVLSAVPAEKRIKKGERKNKLDDGKKLLDKETVFSSVTTEARKKRSYTRKETLTEELQFSEEPVTLKKRKVEKKNRKQKTLPQPFTRYNDMMKQDVSEEVMVSHNELPDSGFKTPDIIFNIIDLNTAKQEYDQSKVSKVHSETASSFQHEISPVDTDLSAVPTGKKIKKRQKKNKLGLHDGKKDLDKETVLSTFSTEAKKKRSYARKKIPSEVMVSRCEHLLDCDSSIKGSVFNQMELNVGKSNKREPSELNSEAASSFQEEIIPVETVQLAVPAGQVIKKRQRKKETELDEGKKDREKETVLSTDSPHTFLEQTEVKKKRSYNSKKPAAKVVVSHSEFFVDSSSSVQDLIFKGVDLNNRTGMDDGNNGLDKKTVFSTVSKDTFSRQTNVPVTVQKKKRCYNRKKAPAEKLKLSEETVTMRERSNSRNKTVTVVMLSHNDYGSAVQDVIFNGTALNASNQEQDVSKFPSESAASFQEEISPFVSVLSAVPARMSIEKRQQKIETVMKDEKNGLDKESSLSTISTESRKKRSYNRKKTLKEESQFLEEYVTLKKRKVGAKKNRKQNPFSQTFSEFNDIMKQDVSEEVMMVSHNMLLPDYGSKTPDTIFNIIDLNTAKQEYDQSKVSKVQTEPASSFQDEISPVETDLSAISGGKTIRKRQKKNKTGLESTVLSTVSTDTFSGQTKTKNKRSYYRAETLRKRRVGVKKSSKQKDLPQTLTEYDDLNELDDSVDVMVSNNEPLLNSGSKTRDIIFNMMSLNSAESNKSEAPVTLQKKNKSYTRKKPMAEESKLSEESGALKRKKMSYNRKKPLTGVMLSHHEPLLDSNSSIKDRIFNGVDVKASNHESGRSEPSELNSEAASSSQDEISPAESVSSAIPVGMTLRKRQLKNETGLHDGKKEIQKETALSTVSTDAKRKRSYTRKKPLTEELNFSEAPERLKRRKRFYNRRKNVAEVVVSPSEPLLDSSSSIHDMIDNRMNLNTASLECDKLESSELKLDAASSFPDEISHAELVPSAVPAGKTIRKRQRKIKMGLTCKKKLQRPPVIAHCSPLAETELSGLSLNSSFCNSISCINDVKKQNMATGTKVKPTSISIISNSPELKSPKLLKCSFCGRSFRHITAFTIHKRIHTGEKPYRCPTCGKRFSQLSHLSAHFKVHSESCAVCCPCCGKTFKSQDKLILHFHIHLNNVKSSNMAELSPKESNNQMLGKFFNPPAAPRRNKAFRCSVCFKEFLNRAALWMHKRSDGGKPYRCSICRQKCRKISILRSHEKTHWPVKPFSCSVCCKGFVRLQDSKHLSKKHSGANLFSCGSCEEAFSSLESLRLHQVDGVCEKQDVTPGNHSGFLLFHSAEGLIATPTYFRCPLCKQLHGHWCQYTLHLQTHANGSSYFCQICRQQYDQAAKSLSHCLVCCRNSGEERSCRSSLTDTWQVPGALEKQVLDDQILPLDGDQRGQMSDIPQVETVEKEVSIMPSPLLSPSSSGLTVNAEFYISPSYPNSEFDQASQQPSRFRLQSQIQRHFHRLSSRWSKLGLHHRYCRRTVRQAFSCSQCELKFSFLGSYMEHLKEHAAQSPHACPLCPHTFANADNLNTHISECHKQLGLIKCSTCGKIFSSLGKLKKHKQLHKRSSSHFCLSCKVSFSSNTALKTHLKTHRKRLCVPQPSGHVEPLLFPYHCRKCTAKFSSTDLLQAHQVCHFTAGKRPESPKESVASCIPCWTSEDAQEDVSEACQRKRCLPMSKKKHLFRYPHPDRLYVAPAAYLEPPVVISDTEEDRQNNTSPSNPNSPPTQPFTGFSSSDLPLSSIPQSSAASSLRNMNENETGCSKNQFEHADKSSISSLTHQDADERDSAEPLLLLSEDRELVEDVYSCVVCMEPFTDISKLREHYMDHTRLM